MNKLNLSIRNINIHKEMRECNIYFENTKVLIRCKRCIYNWCLDCHKQLNKCPYCRKNFRIRFRRRNNQLDFIILNTFGFIQAFIFMFFMICVIVEIQSILLAI